MKIWGQWVTQLQTSGLFVLPQKMHLDFKSIQKFSVNIIPVQITIHDYFALTDVLLQNVDSLSIDSNLWNDQGKT